MAELEPCECGHPAAWHLVGPETWADCDAADCECEMYCGPDDA